MVNKLLVEEGFGSSPAFQNKIYPSITNRLHLNMQFHSEHIFFFFYCSTIFFECIFVKFVDSLLACRLKTMQKDYEWGRYGSGTKQCRSQSYFYSAISLLWKENIHQIKVMIDIKVDKVEDLIIV